MRKYLIQLAVFMYVFFFVASAGMAAETEKSKNWEFNLAPLYLWGASLSGDVTIKGLTQSVDLDFDEIWDNLEGVFTVHFEGVYQKKWGFLINWDYLDLGADNTTRLGTLKVDLRENIAELDGFYRMEKGPHTVDCLIGLRYTDVDAEANFVNTPFSAKGDEGWVDAVIGMRYLYQMTEKWRLLLRGDLGAGGSDFTYQGLGIINFQAWKNVSFFGGYRMLSTDYSTGSGIDTFKYDVKMHGPILGINFSW